MQQSSAKVGGGPSLDDSGLCLLSLDGGGVRGLSTLLILKRLMERTNAERKDQGLHPVKPWELFDLIGGTSTGGLIAIMLGRLKMDVGECIDVYTSMFEIIFDKQKHKYSANLWENFGYLQNRFDSDILRESIKKIVERQGSCETTRLNDEGDRPCHVFVCAKAMENTTTVCLRDYDLVDESNEDAATIVEAALATSAATTFFEPVTIGVRRYVDAALGSNNPVRSVWNEAQNIWCPDDGQLEPRVKCLISIGTGNPGSASVKEGVKDFLTKTLKDIATETEHTAVQSEALFRGLLDQKRYFRYNVEQGLQAIGLEEYRKRADIESATLAYLAIQRQKFSLRDCAKNLGTKQYPTSMKFKFSELAHTNFRTHFLVPHPSSEEFTGRGELMLSLEGVMSHSDRHTRVVLCGLGGIGKTRVALEYAYKWKKSNTTSVFWVHAGSAERIEKGYLDIAKEVGIPGWDSLDPNIDKSALVKEWFERKVLGKWTLILDNADDIEMLYGGPTNSSRMADYFPRAPNGVILLTTRNKKVGTKFTTFRNIIHLPPLDIKESVRLLKAKIPPDATEEQYTSLATALENVPLALVQAAAFISAQSSSVPEYLRLYNQSDTSRIQLLSDEFEDDIRDQETKNPIAKTFVISFEQIKKSDSHAIEILSFMGMLDPQAIPRSLLFDNQDEVIFRKSLGTLLAYSLITESTQQGQEDVLYDLHRLIRLAIQEWLSSNNELQISILNATLTMDERFPYDSHENRETCRTYFPHALIVLSLHRLPSDPISSQIIQPLHIAQKDMQVGEADLLHTVSGYLSYKGDYRLGQSMVQRSLAIREKVLGTEHVGTLDSMYLSAWYLGQQGKIKEAIELGRRTLRLQEKTLGRENPATLTTMVDLGFDLSRHGKHREANQILQRALQLRRKVLGEEHERTLETMRLLSNSLNDEGKYEEAEKMARRTLRLQMKVLGDENPATLNTMYSLAIYLDNQNKHEEAEQMARRTLQLRTKVLSEEHPQTLDTMFNLTIYLDDQNKHEEAEQMARQTLQLQRKVLGEEHPDTLDTMINLAIYLENQNKHEEAEQMARRALQLRMKVLGEEHPRTLNTMFNLAIYLDNQNKHEEAEQMARRTLQLRTKVLSEEHPQTLDTMFNLTIYLDNQNKHEEAEQMARRTLQLQIKVLGDENPDTLNIMYNLAIYLDHQNKHEEAEQMARRTLQLQMKVLGKEHPDTIRSLNNLSWILSRQGKHDEVAQMTRLPLQRPDQLSENRPPNSRTLPLRRSKRRESVLSRLFSRGSRARARALGD